LVCSCVALVCGLFASIPGVILGHLALAEIKKNPHLQGKGMAIAGLIVGYIMILLNVIVIVIYLTMLPTILKQIQNNTPTPTIIP
jgi:peptidyl-prolyl cis-trans isomerase B (cyclophilin B)